MYVRSQSSLSWSGTLGLLAACLGGILVFAYRGDRPLPQAPEPAAESALPAVPLQATMDEAQRAYLWDIEHHGLLLSRYGFGPWADALSRADREGLRGICAADFQGHVLESAQEVRANSDFVDVVRHEGTAGPSVALDRDPFCERLGEYRQRFSQRPKVSLALMGLAPARHGDLDGLWQGTCQLRIWGETSPGQPGEVVLILRIGLPRPAEALFQRGGWLRSCTILQSATAWAPRYLLREVAQERGLDRRRFHDNWEHGIKGTTTGGIYLCDYDRDGLLDLLVVDLNCCALYKGLPGGKFTDVTLEVGLPPRLLNPTGAHLVAAFVDLDGDGWVDLILDNKIYRNEAGRHFQDVTQRSNLRLQGDVSGIAVADYDRDGRLDLYVCRLTPSRASSWLDGKGDGRGGNLLYRNLGDWQFEEVAAAAGATAGDRSTFTAVWLDANNDGWPDLYVLNEFGPGVLLVNQGNGTFREHSLGAGARDFGSMGVTAGDIDNDGNIDLYVANMYSKAGQRIIGNVAPGTYAEQTMATMRSFVTGSQLHRNRGGLRFEPVGQAWQVAAVGWAYGPALIDLDNDGWLDIYATAGFISQDRTKPDG